MLLPRIAQLAHPEHARSLAQLDWAPAAGIVSEMPATLRQSVELPITFPRWRWLDAPVIEQSAELLGAAAAFLQNIALGLARGDPEPLLQAARLRFEELALAYQRPAVDDLSRWRARVQLLHAQKAMRPPLPTPEALRLRACADGRLLECLLDDGRPALRCARPDGSQVFWPMRLAAVERRFYPLR